jgi:hypothetical protein
MCSRGETISKQNQPNGQFFEHTLINYLAVINWRYVSVSAGVMEFDKRASRRTPTAQTPAPAHLRDMGIFNSLYMVTQTNLNIDKVDSRVNIMPKSMTKITRR